MFIAITVIYPHHPHIKMKKMKRLIAKIVLWWSYKWPKKNKRKSIWEL